MCNFKEFSRTKIKISRGSKIAFTAHVWAHRKPKILKRRHFLAYHDFSCASFFKLFFWIFLWNFFVLSISVNEDEVNSKQSQISRSLIKFKKKFLFSRSLKGSWNDITNSSTSYGGQGLTWVMIRAFSLALLPPNGRQEEDFPHIRLPCHT